MQPLHRHFQMYSQNRFRQQHQRRPRLPYNNFRLNYYQSHHYFLVKAMCLEYYLLFLRMFHY